MAEKAEEPTHFSIQKLYIKDVSFESPGSPSVFSFQQWEPQIELNLNNAHAAVDDKLFEAVLTVTATVKHQEKTAFLIEVQQAGLFAISGFNDQDRSYLLGSQCMNILFPYARETISDMTTRGGFPPLILSPVNFDALYQQHMQQQQQAKDGKVEDNSGEAPSIEDTSVEADTKEADGAIKH